MTTTAKALGERTAAELGIDLPRRVLLKFTADQPSLTMSLKVRPRFLVVEDNKIQAYASKEVFERRGAEVTLCFNGRDALNRLEEDVYDAVFMDIEMPVMSGVEAAARIRSAEIRTSRNCNQARQMLIFGVLPAPLHTPDCLGICRDAGMDRYVMKPLVLHANMFCNMFRGDTGDLVEFRTAVLQQHWVSRYNDIKKMFASPSVGTAEYAAFAGEVERRQLDLISSYNEEAAERSEHLKYFSRQKAEEITSLMYRNEVLERKLFEAQQRGRELEESNLNSAVGKTKEKLLAVYKSATMEMPKEKDQKPKIEMLNSQIKVLDLRLIKCKHDLKNTIKTGRQKMKKREDEALKRIRYLEGKNRIIESYLMQHEDCRSLLLPQNFYTNKASSDSTVDLKQSYFVTELEELLKMQRYDNDAGSKDEEEEEAGTLVERILKKELDLWRLVTSRASDDTKAGSVKEKVQECEKVSEDELREEQEEVGEAFFLTQQQVPDGTDVPDVEEHVAKTVAFLKEKNIPTDNYDGTSAVSKLAMCTSNLRFAINSLSEEAALREAALKAKLAQAEETIDDLRKLFRTQRTVSEVARSSKSQDLPKDLSFISTKASIFERPKSRNASRTGTPAGSPTAVKSPKSPFSSLSCTLESAQLGFSGRNSNIGSPRGSHSSRGSALSDVSSTDMQNDASRLAMQERFEISLHEQMSEKLQKYEQDLRAQIDQQRKNATAVQNEVRVSAERELERVNTEIQSKQLELDGLKQQCQQHQQQYEKLKHEVATEEAKRADVMQTPAAPALPPPTRAKTPQEKKRWAPKPPARHQADTTLNLTGSMPRTVSPTVGKPVIRNKINQQHDKPIQPDLQRAQREPTTQDEGMDKFHEAWQGSSGVMSGRGAESRDQSHLSGSSGIDAPSLEHLPDIASAQASKVPPLYRQEVTSKSLSREQSRSSNEADFTSDMETHFKELSEQVQNRKASIRKPKQDKSAAFAPSAPDKNRKQDIKKYFRRVKTEKQGHLQEQKADVQLSIESTVGQKRASRPVKGQLIKSTKKKNVSLINDVVPNMKKPHSPRGMLSPSKMKKPVAKNNATPVVGPGFISLY